MERSDENQRKIYCGNLDPKVDVELLYELFMQAGPIENINMPSSGFAFIVFKHECSVSYAIELFDDTTLYGRLPKLQAKGVPNHHRSQSAPSNYGRNSMGPSPQMDFDSLLQMSRSMMTAPPMGPPPGGFMMGMPPPMSMAPPMGMPPSMGGSLMGIAFPVRPGWRPPMDSSRRPPERMEPPPPGEEMPGSSQESYDDRNMNRNALSHSSLQGNWSARTSSHMLPANDRDRKRNRWGRDSEDSYNQQGRGHADRSGEERSSGYRENSSDQSGEERSSGYRENYFDRRGDRYSGHRENYSDRGGRRYGDSHDSRNRNRDNDWNEEGESRRKSDPRKRRGRF